MSLNRREAIATGVGALLGAGLPVAPMTYKGVPLVSVPTMEELPAFTAKKGDCKPYAFDIDWIGMDMKDQA